MVNVLPSSPPPSGSRLHLARRAGIGACAVAVALGGLGHVIGWKSVGILAAVAAGGAALFFLVRGVRRRRSGGLPPGLRGLPPGLRGGRIPGLPRGLRVPRGIGRGGLPRGMRPPLPRGMRLPSSRSRMPGRSGARGGARAGLPGGSRSRFRPKAAGAPAFRPSRASARSGSGPGARTRSSGLPRPGAKSGARSPGSPGRPGRLWGSGSRSGGGRRSGIGFGGPRSGHRPAGSRPGSPSPARGWRKLVPPRMRPASWTGGTPAPARGWRRLVPPRFRPAAPGTVWPGRGARSRGRHGPPGFMPYRARVRRRWFRWRGRRVKGPQPVRTHRLRPFTGAWLLHHVRRYGRWRTRRAVRRRGSPKWRRMQLFLISWMPRKKNRVQPASALAGPAVTITPPGRAADPDAHRRPRPATPRPAPSTPRPAYTGQPHSPTGGQHMPNVTSAPVEQVVESINAAFGNFNPENIVPDVEAFLENLPKVFDALQENLKKVAGRMDDDMPVHKDVGEAVREMIPPLGGLSERADDAYGTFKSRHEEDLRRHYNPRPHEPAWNVGN